MHTCISSHGLKRSRRSCPRRVNAGNKNTPSTHHPRRRNMATLMVGLKKRSHTQKSHLKIVNPRDIAGERKKKKKKKERCSSRICSISSLCCELSPTTVCSSGQVAIVCPSHATIRVLITCNMLYVMWH